MNKPYTLIVFVLLTVVTVGNSSAQVVRKYSNEFMSIGVGARGMALSNAVTASSDDVNACYYNPAGLAWIDNTAQVALMHCEYFAGVAKYDYGSFAVPFQDKKRVVGFSFYRFGIDDIPNTLFLIGPDGSINYDNIRSFSSADYAFQFHYAQKLPIKGLTAGGSLKIIYRKVGSFAQAVGFGLDAGLQYRYKNWQFGFMARDMSSTFNAWSFSFTDAEKQVLVATNNELPSSTLEVTVPTFTIGVAHNVSIKKKFFILPEIDIVLTTDGKRNVLLKGKPLSLDMNFGLEMNYAKIGYIRVGFGNIQRTTDDQGKSRTSFQPNIGAGVHIKFITIDYSFTNLGNQSEGLYSHVISLRVDINKKTKQ